MSLIKFLGGRAAPGGPLVSEITARRTFFTPIIRLFDPPRRTNLWFHRYYSILCLIAVRGLFPLLRNRDPVWGSLSLLHSPIRPLEFHDLF